VVTDRSLAREFPLILENDEGGAVTKHYREAQMEAYAAGLRACGKLRGRKHSIYEGGNRVPFLVRWPGQAPAGTTCDDLISLNDVLASVAAIVGEQLPDGAGEDSYDVSPLFRGAALKKPIRDTLIVHNAEGVFAIREGPWKYVAPGAAPGARPNSPWTKEGSAAQLYHLGKDLEESTDVIKQHPEVAERLAKLLKQHQDQGFSRPRE
jgi:arylsulfatase A-like enzyme